MYPFRLPRGYVDGEGTLHREGQMRLATSGVTSGKVPSMVITLLRISGFI